MTAMAELDAIFGPAEAVAFFALPHAGEAGALRRWDDLAKDQAAKVAPLEAYRSAAQSVPRAE